MFIQDFVTQKNVSLQPSNGLYKAKRDVSRMQNDGQIILLSRGTNLDGGYNTD